MAKQVIARGGVLYITYDGLLEPLGQSQVLSYQEKLAVDWDIHILSFEKAQDLRRTDDRDAVVKRLHDAGIRWHPRRYHKRFSVLATAYDIVVGIISGLWLVLWYRLHIVHARSYVPSVMVLPIKWLTGVKFIFDMRGFWADERVDGNLWPAGGRLYRVAKWFERQFLLKADYIVSLTKTAVIEMESFNYLSGRMPPIAIIPTCVNLDKFVPHRAASTGEFVLGYVGSAGTWYLFEYVADAFKLLLSIIPTAHFLIINQGEQSYIRAVLERKGISCEDYEVKGVSHVQVPGEMSRMHAGIFFIKQLYSKKASAPTKLGEFLACGIPCISNAEVGDMTEILENEQVGVALDGFSSVEIENGVSRLVELVAEATTASRCRDVAKKHFSLEQGVESYAKIYKSMSSVA